MSRFLGRSQSEAWLVEQLPTVADFSLTVMVILTDCTTWMCLSMSSTTEWPYTDPSLSCWPTSEVKAIQPECYLETLIVLSSWSKTVGVFWHNAAETWIDITNSAADKVQCPSAVC